ncbi:MAG: hypothetical protein GXO38_04000 [Epsilonproteobacteria bacterium]|jgi:predicted metalloprotease|nr:hypothetical protein [Campylobacterota bacterium]
MDLERAKEEFRRYEEMRQEMYQFLEGAIPRKADGSLDLERAGQLDAKELFERWFKLDYQARRIRAIAIECLGLKGE